MKRAAAFVVVMAVLGAAAYQLWHYVQGTGARGGYRVTEVCHPCLTGWAINNRGHVAGVLELQGNRQTSDALQRASLWQPGQGSLDLGTLGGPSSQAQDINDEGVVVGIADLRPGPKAQYSTYQPSDGFIWQPRRGMVRMTTLIPGRWVEGISPVAINNHGQVVGCATFHGYDGYHAFFWDPNRGMQDLGTLGGKYSCAVGVNDRGQVIGNSDLPGRQGQAASHAFLWQAGKKMRDLGTLGGAHSHARDINNAGHVVGSSQTRDGDVHAYLWKPSHALKDLGTLGGGFSGATGINDAGLVVGDSMPLGEPLPRAFIWEEGRGMRDLHDLLDPDDALATQVLLRTPRGINDRGQILVEGEFVKRSRTFGVILSPVGSP